MTPPTVPRPNDAWVLVATILASSMAFLDQSAVNVILAVVQRELHATAAELLWFVNGYLLMLASLILVGGALGDRIGRRKVFAGGIALFTFGSLACALSPSAAVLIAARLVQGVGGAFMIPGSLSLISAHFPADRRGRAIGTWSAVTTITAVAGPVLGGLFAGVGLWRIVFLLNLPLGLASLAIVWKRVPIGAPPSAERRIDLAGTVLVTIALAAISFALIAGPQRGFASARILGALALGAAALAGFVVVEIRSPAPLLPLRLFRNRVFAGANLLTLFLYGALAVFSLFLPLTMIEAQGFTPEEAGLALLPFAALLAGLSRWAGRLSDRVGALLPLVLGPSLVAIGFLALAFSVAPGQAVSYWSGYLPGILIFGVGMGITVVPLTSAVMGALDQALSGTASGVNNAVSRVAGVLAIASFGAVALAVFPAEVNSFVARLGLTAQQLAALDAQLGRLGAARVPEAIPPTLAGSVAEVLHAGLGETFRIILAGCSGLAALSAVCAVIFLRRQDFKGLYNR